jgi:heptosyltransferase-2
MTSKSSTPPIEPPFRRLERILVRAPNWLGDVVMSLPALRAVRRAFPDARLSILIKQELASFFDGSAWVEEVIAYKVSQGLRGLWDRSDVIRRIRAGRFDIAILFPGSFSSALWVTLAGVPVRAGFALDGRGFLLTHKTNPEAAALNGHQVHYHLSLLEKTLGISGNPNDFVPDVHEPHRHKMRAWLEERRRRSSSKLIGLAPAAAYGPAKEWPADRYAGLIDLLSENHGAECVLLGAPAERARCETVASLAAGTPIVAAGEASVGEAIALLSLCDAFVGNDSGSMHVAGALGVPTAGIFGSTRPDRTAPLGPRTKVLYEQIECSPCMQRTCRFGHYECLKRISIEAVAAALDQLGAFR